MRTTGRVVRFANMNLKWPLSWPTVPREATSNPSSLRRNDLSIHSVEAMAYDPKEHNPQGPIPGRNILGPTAVVSLVVIFVYLMSGDTIDFAVPVTVEIKKEEEIPSFRTDPTPLPPLVAPTVGSPPSIPSASSFESSPKTGIDTASLLTRFQRAKDDLTKQLQQVYGPYYEPMFMETKHGIFPDNSTTMINRARYIFRSQYTWEASSSWNRLKRKLVMKLLQALLAPSDKTTFVWASGGHSAAAAHGNLYAESYTAVMERTVRPLFTSVGLDFIGRNYAMGGTMSAPEVAACEEAIFGTDIDMLSWDFGMTDAYNPDLMKMYFARAGIHRNRPALLAFQISGSSFKVRSAMMEEFEKAGLAAFYGDPTAMDRVVKAAPDSFGHTEEKIKEWPAILQHLKCQDGIESGEPFCRLFKFNLTICPNRKGQTSWHPGWKMHAINGHMLALFLAEVLEDALKQLFSRDVVPLEFLSALREAEDDDYVRFRQANFSDCIPVLLRNSQIQGELDMDLLVREPNICHTATLPAETRFKGILTETDQIGFTTYDKGLLFAQVSSPNEKETMRLVHDGDGREGCEELTDVDYKDFFYIGHGEGWKKLIIPNESELKEYGTDQKLRGLISICMAVCSWGKCPKGHLMLAEALHNKTAELEVNGQPVVGITPFVRCDLLRGAQGYYFSSDSAGRFEIRARVTSENSFLRFSSFIVW